MKWGRGSKNGTKRALRKRFSSEHVIRSHDDLVSLARHESYPLVSFGSFDGHHDADRFREGVLRVVVESITDGDLPAEKGRPRRREVTHLRTTVEM